MHQRFSSLLRLKAAEGSTVEGYAARFNVKDRHGESFLPGCFTQSLARGDAVGLLLNHRPDHPAGAWTELAETPEGLKVRGQLATDSPLLAPVLPVLKLGGMSLSAGFYAEPADLTKQADGSWAFARVDLVEISLTAVPAGRGTGVSLKQATVRDLEELLHTDGYSRAESKLRAKTLFLALHATPDESDDDPPDPQDLSAFAERVRRMNSLLTKGIRV